MPYIYIFYIYYYTKYTFYIQNIRYMYLNTSLNNWLYHVADLLHFLVTHFCDDISCYFFLSNRAINLFMLKFKN